MMDMTISSFNQTDILLNHAGIRIIKGGERKLYGTDESGSSGY